MHVGTAGVALKHHWLSTAENHLDISSPHSTTWKFCIMNTNMSRVVQRVLLQPGGWGCAGSPAVHVGDVRGWQASCGVARRSLQGSVLGNPRNRPATPRPAHHPCELQVTSAQPQPAGYKGTLYTTICHGCFNIFGTTRSSLSDRETVITRCLIVVPLPYHQAFLTFFALDSYLFVPCYLSMF